MMTAMTGMQQPVACMHAACSCEQTTCASFIKIAMGDIDRETKDHCITARTQ